PRPAAAGAGQRGGATGTKIALRRRFGNAIDASRPGARAAVTLAGPDRACQAGGAGGPSALAQQQPLTCAPRPRSGVPWERGRELATPGRNSPRACRSGDSGGVGRDPGEPPGAGPWPWSWRVASLCAVVPPGSIPGRGPVLHPGRDGRAVTTCGGAG